ncbi:MAG TPA: PAS domain-containing protein [bacterium]|nr:PAS domain-containing protein [bacterium]
MGLVADKPRDAVAGARLRFDAKGVLLRGTGLATGGGALALWCGMSWPAVLMLASMVVLVAFLERTALRREAATRVQQAATAARVDGQRDAIAQVMSLELGYERSRSVLEALREGVLVVDESGEIVLANPAAAGAMRRSAGDAIGRTLWDELLPGLAGRAREAFEALREDGGEGELPQIRYSGIPCHDRVFDLTAVRVTSRRTGQDFGTVFLFVDATRTHELQRIKDRFLSNVSHELRTPLTNICAYSELLQHMLPGESAEWPEFVRVIHDEGVALSELVDAMFDFLQLESGEAEFASEVVDGGEVVRRVVAERGERAGARGVEIEVEIDDGAPSVQGDARRIEQVVGHLLDNAVKFSPQNGRIRCSVAGREEGWELRIEDQGPGVPVPERQAVFEKFNQLRDQLTDKPSGTGLGLATSRAIVARLGGLIWCEDSPSGGARFVVLLPAVGQPKLAGFGAGTGAGGGF